MPVGCKNIALSPSEGHGFIPPASCYCRHKLSISTQPMGNKLKAVTFLQIARKLKVQLALEIFSIINLITLYNWLEGK